MKWPAAAWDVYFVYGRDAEWAKDPLAPDYWMHQLMGLPPERITRKPTRRGAAPVADAPALPEAARGHARRGVLRGLTHFDGRAAGGGGCRE